MIYVSTGGGREMPVEGDVVVLFEMGVQRLFRVGVRSGEVVCLHGVPSPPRHDRGALVFSFSEEPVMQVPASFLLGTGVLFHGDRWENPPSGR